MFRGSCHLLLQISAEGEGVCLNAGIEELDFECAVGDGAALPDELIEPLSGDDTLAVGIHIRAVVVGRPHTIDGDAKSHGLAIGRRAENQMEVAGMKFVDDAATAFI